MDAEVVLTESKDVAGEEREAAPREGLLAARWMVFDMRVWLEEVVGGVMLPVVVGLADSRQAEIGPR